ncbi:MAG: glutamine-hydrolyzing carbamoyl-phosphate synthase small subunit [Planctomycetota bacterium]
MKAVLVLEDGTILSGKGFGAAHKSAFGELVFNTGMTGYQEALTDPSYNGQILMMTYPLIGNYGCTIPDKYNFNQGDAETTEPVNKSANPSVSPIPLWQPLGAPADIPPEWQSGKIQAEGFVVREFCTVPLHRASEMTIDEFLKLHGIPGISEIDTRALTIKIRQLGTMKSVIATYENESDINIDKLLQTARNNPSPDTTNLVNEVSTPKICQEPPKTPGHGKTIVIIDCGVKENIIRELTGRGCAVIRVPYNTTADQINQLKPDGILVSNGPGDPAHPDIMNSTVKTLQSLVGRYPIFGICLGHQILSLVFGGKTYKLKFGHRGANQPVKDLCVVFPAEAGASNKVYITSQNHGFAVDPSSLPADLEITGVNVNDGTVEAMRHKKLPVFSVQYHPEASPGPWDSKYLFDKFVGIK